MMLLRNFYNLVGAVLQSSTVVDGTLPVTDVYGMQGFLTGQFAQFPYTRTAAYTSDRYASGITVGRGTRETSDTDYQLEDPLSSGVSVTLTKTNVSTNGGRPYLGYSLTVTNTSSGEVVVGEVCYKQPVTATPRLGGSTGATVVVMLDRTVLEPAITLQPGEAAVIQYRLSVDATYEGEANGVKVVSWQFGSDEDVAAMVLAARAGTIDLRTHGGWQLGDLRKCDLAAFSAGGVSVPAQSVDLAITSFSDYGGSGGVMTVDFAEALSSAVRMHSSNSNSGGYGLSEMAVSTLPAIHDAMPQYLRDLALEFSVQTSEGSNSATIESVSGNRLALRSEVEVRGATGGGSKAGEGEAVAWYQTASKMRQKRRGRDGSANTYWLRSPASNSTQYVSVNKADATTYGSVNASSANGVAPFMCL